MVQSTKLYVFMFLDNLYTLSVFEYEISCKVNAVLWIIWCSIKDILFCIL